MKNTILYILIACFLYNCKPATEIIPEIPENCSTEFEEHQNHPKAAIYQEILDRNRKLGIVGATMLVKDRDGVWSGASGMADLKNNRPMRSCDRMMIASISKPFTATVIMKLIDEGLLTLESDVKDYVSAEIVKKVANVNTAKIKHLLSHRSGIPDYYNMSQLLDQINTDGRTTTFEGFLKYVYGKKAEFEVDESYAYSNNNFVLLGIVAEQVTNKTLKQLYQEIIFDPLQLTSAYFDIENPFPLDMPIGYADVYADDSRIESEFLYGDEARTPDGGIIINNLDLHRFFETLWKGEIVHQERVNEMTNWFDLPEDWKDYEVFGQLKNGYGLEHFENEYAYALGHTGGVDGFLSYAFYYPEKNYSIILVINTADQLDSRIDIYKEAIEVMFND